MNRQQKEAFVQSLEQDFATNNGAYLVAYKGLTVAQLTSLRKKLRAQDGALQVAKVRLIRRAIAQNSVLHSWEPLLKDQVAIIFSRDGSPAFAKTVYDFSKANQQLSIIAGCVDNEFLSKADLSAFVSLPSREVLLGQLLGTMKAPVGQFVGLLKMLMIRLVFVLKQIEDKKAH
jgi:large subunit ribosomal protein L10